MSNPGLRARIVRFMLTQGPAAWVPTWWFRHHVAGYDTAGFRAELQLMETEGLVVADRRVTNNTMWQLQPGATTDERD